MVSEQVLLAGCGDLGLRVAQLLHARGDEVWALRRQPPLASGDIHWLRADLTDPVSLRDLPSDITRLVYLPTPDRRDPAAYRAIFVDGLRHLLDALEATAQASPCRMLFVSSSAVYGEHGGEWVNEDTPAAPAGFNGAALLEAEQLLAARTTDSIVLRLAGLYGAGRMQLIERLRMAQVAVPRQVAHWANRIHVDDAARAIVHLLQLTDPQSLYLGVDSTPLPLDVLYDHLAGLIGAPLPAEGAAPAGIGSKQLSNRRLRDSGFVLRWPDSRAGYAALLDT